jgi:hypothetical protein
VVPGAVVMQVPDIKVTGMPSFSMPKLDMPKINVPSPLKFNVPVHPPPKPAMSLMLSTSSVLEFKVLDTGHSPQV